MTRSRLVRSLLLPLVTLTGCFSPHDPIIVSASDSAATDSGTDTTMGPASDPTIGSATEPTGSTEPTASTTASTTDTADSSTSDTDPTGSTDDGGPLCGNMMLDGDEVCDDGNDVNGDGCNNDCIESGTELWMTEVSEEYEISDAARIGVDGSDHSHVVFAVYSPDYDYSTVLRELDPDGNIVTTVEVDSPNPDPDLDVFTADITVAPDGSLVLTGQMEDAPDDHAFLFRYDAGGTRDWSRVIDPGTYSLGTSVDFDDDGSFAFAGHQGYNPGDGLVAVYDALGNELWSEVYDVAAAVGFYGVDARADEVFVVGKVGENPGDIWLRKYTANGVAVWTRTYDQAMGSNDGANAVAADGSGNVFVAGFTHPTGDDADGWIAKYSSDGDPVWQHAIDGGAADTDIASDVVVDASDNVIVVGRQTTLAGATEAFVTKYDNDGNALWSNVWNGDGNEEYSLGVATTSGGEIVVAAYESDDDGTHIRVRCFAQ